MYTHGSSRTYVQSNATRIARSPVGTLHIYGAPPGWGKGRNSHGDDETQVGYGEGKKKNTGSWFKHFCIASFYGSWATKDENDGIQSDSSINIFFFAIITL